MPKETNFLLLRIRKELLKYRQKCWRGEAINISIEPGHGDGKSCLHPDVRLAVYPPEGFVDVLITSKEGKFDAALVLRPREYVDRAGL